MSVRVLLTLFTACITICHAADEVFGDMKDTDYWSRTLVVPAERIVLPDMEKVAREFLKRAGSRKVVILTVYSTRDIAGRQLGFVCLDYYKAWRHSYDQFPRDSLAAANMIAIGGDAVLRLRHVDGTVARRVLSGKDPTQLLIDGVAFELLHIAGREMSGFIRCDIPGQVGPQLYFRTDAKLTPELCERATAWIARLLPRKNMFASFRNDAVFACDSFPVVYPFSPPTRPPTETEYNNSLSFVCSVFCGEKEAHCTQTGGPSQARPPVPAKQ